MIYGASQRKKAVGNIIKSIPFFADLTTEEVDQLEQLISKRRFSKGQIVLYEEDTASYMYIVYVGKVRVVKLNADGREQIITIHKKNDFFGEMALLDGKTAPATIIAHEEAVIGLLSRNNFEQYLLKHDGVRQKIVDLLCCRLREAWAMIKILGFDDAEQRVMAVLDCLQELYGVKDDRGIILNVKLTHKQIASYAALVRETVTRILNRLEKEGAIEVLDNKSILLTKKFHTKFRGST